MLIGQRIKSARNDAKMTQGQLGAKVGMSQSAISELETGESASSTLIASLAAALGVNALWLETGKGDRHGQVTSVATGRGEARTALTYEDAEVLLDLYRRADERGRINALVALRSGAGDAAADSSNKG